VMDQYKQFNTNPARPLFVVLHHDGDNYGGGSEAYYHGNFQNMVHWAAADADYDVTTIQDYLDRFPVPASDVIHVEPGSWAGADNGDPQFRKWLGPRDGAGWSPDQNSWAVLTAAKNRVFTAEDVAPIGTLRNVLDGVGSATERAWHHLLEAQASDYWYWDGTEIWDSDVTRGANLAVQQADLVLAGRTGPESTAPSVFLPQRSVWNPGAREFGVDQPRDFEVWTFAYDVSGLQSVTLKYRLDVDGVNPLSSVENETYAGGGEVHAWQSVTMSGTTLTSPAGILAPTYRAQRFAGTISGVSDSLVDYYVEAVDQFGNVTKTDIQHVYVGPGSGTSGGGGTGGGTGGGGTTPPAASFTMDGVLDAAVTLAGTNSGMSLWYGTEGTQLYVATPDAGEGSDHFIFVARTPGAPRAAPWAKAGQVAGWDGFVADENSNGYSGWFDVVGGGTSATGANGGVLEGVIDLMSGTGGYPTEIHLAVGLYGNGDGGTLLATHQIAASADGDGTLDADEFVRIPLPEATLVLDVAQGVETQGAKGRPVIAGNVQLVKTGSGTLVLDAANRYAGDASVLEGTLAVSGSGALGAARQVLVDAAAVLDVSGGLTLGSGQTLAGTGTVAGSVVFGRGATLSPGTPSASRSGAAVAAGSVVAVPEPGSLVLGLLGAAGAASMGIFRQGGRRRGARGGRPVVAAGPD